MNQRDIRLALGRGLRGYVSRNCVTRSIRLRSPPASRRALHIDARQYPHRCALSTFRRTSQPVLPGLGTLASQTVPERLHKRHQTLTITSVFAPGGGLRLSHRPMRGCAEHQAPERRTGQSLARRGGRRRGWGRRAVAGTGLARLTCTVCAGCWWRRAYRRLLTVLRSGLAPGLARLAACPGLLRWLLAGGRGFDRGAGGL